MLEETKFYFRDVFPLEILMWHRHKWAWYGLSWYERLFLKLFYKINIKDWEKEEVFFHERKM